MNLVEQLLKADAKTAEELNTGVFESKRLAKIIGADTETVSVEIKEIKSRRMNDIGSYTMDNKGNYDRSKLFDANLMIITEGCVNPNLRDKELQAHFGCTSAKDLAEKLFGGEASSLSDAIATLSGIVETEEEEIKN